MVNVVSSRQEPSFRSRSHIEERVEAPDGSRYRVRVTRAGVRRYSPLEGSASFVAVAANWLRYWVARRWSWSLEVQGLGVRMPPDKVAELFEDRTAAAERAEQIVAAIQSGSYREIEPS